MYLKNKSTDLTKTPRTQYTNTAQPIKGRITYCLMTRFERLWLDSQKGTLPSLKLDYCSKRLLGEDAGKKRTNAKFTDDDFFRRSWLEDTEVFLEYNRVDVELMVRMDDEMNISDLYIDKKFIAQTKLMMLHFFHDALKNNSKNPEFWTDILYLGMKVGEGFAPHAKIS